MTANVIVNEDPENKIKRIMIRKNVAIITHNDRAAMPELTIHNFKDTRDLDTRDLDTHGIFSQIS